MTQIESNEPTSASSGTSRRSVLRLVSGALGLPLASLAGGCAGGAYREQGLMIGSTVSRNLFMDANQFGNKSVKVRLRNSSGDPSIDMTRMRGDVEANLRSAGYSIANATAGIVMDANLYFLNNVATGRQRASNDVGALLGGVAGYEAAKGRGGVGAGSGAILGAIAGATLQDVLRQHNEYGSYLAVCDVNLGVVRQQNTKRDNFVIGGNRFDQDRQREQEDQALTFESFALRETVKVYVWAGDLSTRKDSLMWAIQERLARVVANLI